MSTRMHKKAVQKRDQRRAEFDKMPATKRGGYTRPGSTNHKKQK